MRYLLAALAAALLALAACTSGGGPKHIAPLPLGTGTPSIPGVTASIPVLPVPVHDPGQVTGTMISPCHARDKGTLPDRTCTPGAYDPSVTAAALCAPGYSTSSYRPPASMTTAFKYQEAEPAYGQDHIAGELDHLIPLELAGGNDAKNLWVEAGKIPNAKDSVENALHDWVCSASGNEAETRLRLAQAAIALNWHLAERHLGIS